MVGTLVRGCRCESNGFQLVNYGQIDLKLDWCLDFDVRRHLPNFVDPYIVLSEKKSGEKKVQEKGCFSSCDLDKGQRLNSYLSKPFPMPIDIVGLILRGIFNLENTAVVVV